MGNVTVQSRFGDINVKIAGDKPTFEEFLKISLMGRITEKQHLCFS